MELQIIQNKIYEIRNCRVMLDFDLAEMYQVETRVLNQTVRRNINRFPEDFMFQLTEKEWERMSSQFVMTSGTKRPKTALPLAFTQEGVAMLSGILRSPIAIQVNIDIMRAFVVIRNYMLLQSSISTEIESLWRALNDLSEDNRKELDDIYLAIAELASKQTIVEETSEEPRRPIGYQHYNRNETQ